MKKSFNKTFNWYQKKNVAFFNIELNFSEQIFLYKQIMTGKSYMRATHNLFLKKRLRINNLTGDLGSGGKNDYNKFIFKNLNLVKSFDFYKSNNSTIKINLEKNFSLKKYKLKNIQINLSSLKKYDCIVIVTDHSYFNYKMIEKHANLVVDCRGKIKKISKQRIRA